MSVHYDPFVQHTKTLALAKASSVSINQAINVVLMSIRGTVVDAKLKGKPGNVHWRIKVLTAEGIVKVYIDGHSGDILEAWSEGSLSLPDDTILPQNLLLCPKAFESTLPPPLKKLNTI